MRARTDKYGAARTPIQRFLSKRLPYHAQPRRSWRKASPELRLADSRRKVRISHSADLGSYYSRRTCKPDITARTVTFAASQHLRGGSHPFERVVGEMLRGA